MDTVFLVTAVLIIFFMFLSFIRAVIGPTAPDRLVAANAVGSKTTVLLIFIGLIYGRVDMFVDIALAYALLNFIGVLAISKYFLKKKNLEAKMARLSVLLQRMVPWKR